MFVDCCGPALDDSMPAATAERLMRSRYSAFVIGDSAYLLRTWHPRTRPAQLHLEPGQKWLGLSIRGVEGGGPLDEFGSVEFVARSKIDGRGVRLHETSRFQRVAGRWTYLDGVLHARGRRAGR